MATDLNSLLAGPNIACYNSMSPGEQNAIELSLLQDWLNNSQSSPVTPWTPNTPGTLVEWLKADALSLSSGASVATWTANAGNNATATGAQEPTFITNNQNGLPIVRFNGSSNKMATASFGAQVQPFTVAMAFRDNGTGANEIFFDDIVSSTELGASGGSFLADAGTFQALKTFDNNFHILFIVFHAASTQYAFDGAALQTVGGTIGTNSISGLTLGISQPGILPSQTDIGEILVWSGNGSSFYTSAFNYLNARWA